MLLSIQQAIIFAVLLNAAGAHQEPMDKNTQLELLMSSARAKGFDQCSTFELTCQMRSDSQEQQDTDYELGKKLATAENLKIDRSALTLKGKSARCTAVRLNCKKAIAAVHIVTDASHKQARKACDQQVKASKKQNGSKKKNKPNNHR